MRKIKKGTAPKLLLKNTTTNHLKLVVSSRNDGSDPVEKIKSSIYRGSYSSKQSVVSHLKELYKDKCAFCESRRTKLDVDHYRPKGAIKDVSGHPGYYWLCYEWSNLIYVCKDCNRDYKRTEFPIYQEKNRCKETDVTTYPDVSHEMKDLEELLKSEQPLLLHPEEKDFDPHKYFKFLPDGRLKGKDINDKNRGQTTIDVCELDRPDLWQARGDQIENFREYAMAVIVITWEETKSKKAVKKQLDKALDRLVIKERQEFIVFWEQVFLHFEKFIIEFIEFDSEPNGFLEILKDVFQEKFKDRIAAGEVPDFLMH